MQQAEGVSAKCVIGKCESVREERKAVRRGRRETGGGERGASVAMEWSGDGEQGRRASEWNGVQRRPGRDVKASRDQ